MTAGSSAEAYLDGEIAARRPRSPIYATTASIRAGRAGLRRAAVQRRRAVAGARCDMSWVWSERRQWRGGGCDRLVDAGFISGVVGVQAPGTIRDRRVARRLYWPAIADPLRGRWSGPLYVLTNGGTYSAAELFATALQNNRAARIVGTRTGGDGCGFMVEGEPIPLPRTGLRVLMPNCVRLRADGSNEVAGVTPDLAIRPRRGEGARARAARLIAAILADRRALR